MRIDIRGKTSETQRAFTLIELLVVIAVIAILAVLLLSVFSAARERAHSSRCQSNLKQIHSAIRLYMENWDGDMNPRLVIDDYAPYLKGDDVYRCPSNPVSGMSRQEYWRYIGYGSMPLDQFSYLKPISYWFPLEFFTNDLYNDGSQMCFYNPDLLYKDPSNTILVYEGLWLFDPLYFSDCSGLYWIPAHLPIIGAYHNGGSNYLFIDGHVKHLRLSQTAYPLWLWPHSPPVYMPNSTNSAVLSQRLLKCIEAPYR